MILLFATLTGAFSYLLGSAIVALFKSRVERESFLKDLRQKPIITVISLVFMFSFFFTIIGLFLASIGYEPELFETEWKIWHVTGLITIALLLFA